MENEFETIRDIVKEILEVDEKARSSDKWLIIQTLRKLGFKIFVDYNELDNMPSFETIRRTRQKLFEEYPYLKADEVIEDLRRKKQEEYKEFFGTRTRGVEIENTIKKGIAMF